MASIFFIISSCIVKNVTVLCPLCVFRMRSAVLFLLIITVPQCSGNIQPKINIYPNRSTPCQRSQIKSAFSTFMSRHILLLNFDTTNLTEWGRYLVSMGLCDRKPNKKQSFLHISDTQSVIKICEGEGIKYEGNMCISTKKFLVFVVQSNSINGNCEYVVQFEMAYVVVACEAIETICLPVHFEKQIDTAPPRNGQICQKN